MQHAPMGYKQETTIFGLHREFDERRKAFFWVHSLNDPNHPYIKNLRSDLFTLRAFQSRCYDTTSIFLEYEIVAMGR
jgi:hypothetical protein